MFWLTVWSVQEVLQWDTEGFGKEPDFEPTCLQMGKETSWKFQQRCRLATWKIVCLVVFIVIITPSSTITTIKIPLFCVQSQLFHLLLLHASRFFGNISDLSIMFGFYAIFQFRHLSDHVSLEGAFPIILVDSVVWLQGFVFLFFCRGFVKLQSSTLPLVVCSIWWWRNGRI